MERAVFLTQADAVPAGDWSRLYYGSEFCSWTFPSDTEIITAIKTARSQDFSITLVTPVVSQLFLPRLRQTLELVIPQLGPDDEIVASDLGTIRVARQLSAEVTLVVGRTLSGQKRGPRILDLNLNDVELDYFQRGSWYQAEAVISLHQQGIKRIELDNLLQGIAPLPEGLTGTLHIPWAMVTSSRNCPYRQSGQTGPCPGGCGEVMKLTTPQTLTPLFQSGNSQFLQHDQIPENLATLGIDRVVEHLQLPR